MPMSETQSNRDRLSEAIADLAEELKRVQAIGFAAQCRNGDWGRR